MSEWDEQTDHDRKYHLDVVVGAEADCEQHEQLQKLDCCEEVNDSLRNTTKIVSWWVGALK